ncbi:MAG: hypothetical protein SOZ59_06675 [Candidatus Limivivens sp.]|nr:hypothetical protein [Candidatus Limivivens sp.]
MESNKESQSSCAGCQNMQDPVSWQDPGRMDYGRGRMRPDYEMRPGRPGYDMWRPGYEMRPGRFGYDRGYDRMEGQPWPGMPRPMPYYRAYELPMDFSGEMENERDMERLKEMYPDVAREILQYVEEECDKLEYEGSMMFDEQPDQVQLEQIIRRICDKMKDHYEVQEGSDTDDMLVMNQEAQRRYPPGANWLGDMARVILFQEMHRRRCRRRNCRRWY